MLKYDERVLLQAQFALALAGKTDVRGAISLYFDVDAPKVLLALPMSLTSADEYASGVINICLGSRWTEAPCWLDRLLSKLLEQGVAEGTDMLNRVLTRVRRNEDPTLDYYDTQWVLRGQPFLSRNRMRVLLKEFITKNDKPLLCIYGPGAGRSYTGEFVDFLADQSGDLHAVLDEVPSGSGASYTIKDFVAKLAAQMGSDIPEPSGSNDAASLARSIVARVRAKPGKWIFFLDGFGQPDLQEDVRQLVEQLAQVCIMPEVRKIMRIILTSYPGPIPKVPDAFIHIEKIATPTVKAADLVGCLLYLNNQLTAEHLVPFAPAGLDAIANVMLGGATGTDKEKLKHCNDLLRDLAANARGQI